MPDTSLCHLAFADLDLELGATRRLLEAAPEAHFGWRPHEKSWTLGQLTAHIANLYWWGTMTLTQDEFDMGAPMPPVDTPETSEELLATFDRNVATFREALDAATDADLERPWTLRSGDRHLSTDPTHLVLRRFTFSHIAHHRGQLTLYLRLLEIPVPGVYGPSQDDRAGLT